MKRILSYIFVAVWCICTILLALNSSTDIVKLSDKAFEFVIFMMVFGIFGTMVFSNILTGRIKFRAARIVTIILSGIFSVLLLYRCYMRRKLHFIFDSIWVICPVVLFLKLKRLPYITFMWFYDNRFYQSTQVLFLFFLYQVHHQQGLAAICCQLHC